RIPPRSKSGEGEDAAVQCEGLAGQITAGVRTEERDRGGDVRLRVAVVGGRAQGRENISRNSHVVVRWSCRIHFPSRADLAREGTVEIDDDAVLEPFARGGSSERPDRFFGRRIRPQALEPDESGTRADIDDSPPTGRLHMWIYRLHSPERAFDRGHH